MRALELTELGASLHPAGEDRLWTEAYRHPTRVVGLRVERAELHRRIAARAEAMFAAGVVEEVRAALERGGAVRDGRAGARPGRDPRRHRRRQTSSDEACRRLVERTRQYARRQEIWMRRIPGIELVDAAAVGHLE